MSAIIPALLGLAENVLLPALGQAAGSFITNTVPSLIRGESPSHIEHNSVGRPTGHASVLETPILHTTHHHSRVPIRSNVTDTRPIFHNSAVPSMIIHSAPNFTHSDNSFSSAPVVPVTDHAAGLVGRTRYMKVHHPVTKHHTTHHVVHKKKKKSRKPKTKYVVVEPESYIA